MSADKRLFFALLPDPAARAELKNWQRACFAPDANFTHPDDLHITLHFLGNVAQSRITELISIGDQLLGQAIDLKIDRFGLFHRPKILWAGCESEPDALHQLQADLGKLLRKQGFTVENRPYRPHVTLARKVAEIPPHTSVSPFVWQANTMALLESRLGHRPLYSSVAEWDF